MSGERVRRLAWIAAFGALVVRAVKGLNRLDEPELEDQQAIWPPLPFDSA